MDKIHVDRKKELVKNLEKSYKSKPSKWFWQNFYTGYKTTKAEAEDSGVSYYDESPIIVKNEYSFYVVELKALAIFVSIFLVLYFINWHFVLLARSLICFLMLVVTYYNARKVVTHVEINSIGIKFLKENIIAWENIIATYTHYEQYGENINVSILIYHYDFAADNFLETKTNIEFKGWDYCDICFYIEYWKAKKSEKF